jgi:hypothetical protein
MTQRHDPTQNLVWPQELQDDPMVAGVGNDDFTKFLDLDLDLDNDFSQFEALPQTHTGLDTPMGRLGFGNNTADMTYATQEHLDMGMNSNNHPTAYRNIMPNQPYGQYQQYQMQMPTHYHVPPTPVSAEMHAAKYVQHMSNDGQILFDHQQVSFTPLVSPAQTPMDNVFSINDYGLADDFFSPLTSPAIEAQAAYTGTTSSPADLNLDLGTSSKQPVAGTKRPRRRPSNTSRTPARSVRQSPAMKPQHRRKNPSLQSLHLEKIQAMFPQSNLGGSDHFSAPNSAVLPPSDNSVSPEPLTEAVMRPPPVPQASKSPLPSVLSQKDANNNPVTPATLMRMPSNQSLSTKHAEQVVSLRTNDEPMEDIMLPAAASNAPPALNTAVIDNSRAADSNESTPTLPAKSAKLTAGGTPRNALGRTASQELFAKPGKVESRGGRGNKKRQSISSAAISPALRPKISPSISPLVPATGPGMSHVSPDASALFLASKSNYQNILEGTHLPGVSYPEALAENLTSKRTSHKIAEQGRRNRINLALKEIEGLIPPSISGAHSKKERASSQENDEAEAKSAATQSGSKASTVEMAIVYIKSLQSELAEAKGKLEAAEKRLAAGSSSGESQASEV